MTIGENVRVERYVGSDELDLRKRSESLSHSTDRRMHQNSAVSITVTHPWRFERVIIRELEM